MHNTTAYIIEVTHINIPAVIRLKSAVPVGLLVRCVWILCVAQSDLEWVAHDCDGYLERVVIGLRGAVMCYLRYVSMKCCMVEEFQLLDFEE